MADDYRQHQRQLNRYAGEKMLLLAVLEDALAEVMKYDFSKAFYDQSWQWIETYLWFESTSHDGLYSFERICAEFGDLNSDDIRQRLSDWHDRCLVAHERKQSISRSMIPGDDTDTVARELVEASAEEEVKNGFIRKEK